MAAAAAVGKEARSAMRPDIDLFDPGFFGVTDGILQVRRVT
jgi:hypothetical protein